MVGVTTLVILDKRRELKNETFPVKLRVTFNRKQKYYPLGKFLTEKEWEKIHGTKPRGEYKELTFFFSKTEQRALEIIDNMISFTFNSFEKKFNDSSGNRKDALFALDLYASRLKRDERHGTANSYNNALNSFKTFLKERRIRELLFHDITPEWLQGYEYWMIENKKSLTTVGIYLRNLRTVINIAIEDGNHTKDLYPFGKRKYQIPSGRNIKKALSLAEIKKIVQYKPVTTSEAKARDLWLFSYLCNGANVKDIVRLKYKNISSKNITFIRAKTELTSKTNQKPITAPLLPEITEIINRWGSIDRSQNTYVFGLINKSDLPEKQLAKVKQVTKTINKYMQRIGEKLKIEDKITTYTARHSYATVLKRSGASTEFISESLGHKDLRTTENYLDSFEDEQKLKFQKRLLDFK